MQDSPEIALEWLRAGRGAALATVIETWGSAPRPVGSQLAVSGAGEIAGSVSGGCVEGAVVAEALEALEDGRPRILTFGVSDDDAFAVGLACGGTIRVLVEPVGAAAPALSPDLLAALVAARAARRPVACLTDLATWDRRLVPAPEADAALAERFRADRSGPDGDTFVAIHNPPLRLVVVGAVHIAQPLVAMARMAGFDPAVVDPRAAFASPERFPGQPLSHDWPDAALTALGLDARTAVVTLTHDPKLDDPAILTALGAPVFYLGCLGSTRTHAKRLERLRAAGVAEAELARLRAPVGLPIGARSPAEIAVAILAQIIETLRKG
ncbi:XdhC family protein [Rhodobaculum claviforme]|uniref:XdhC/CoxI family protein n=1 Tax=Rhodobaculum claviforme TaxID=1549854 RepID=A0A934TLE4_9RHOB|nr:XdhC family protein [Rhodobaculum claviforme]MBK5927666.1 XdhC/CoxI family protein [Rhodobaculum claviforme]